MRTMSHCALLTGLVLAVGGFSSGSAAAARCIKAGGWGTGALKGSRLPHGRSSDEEFGQSQARRCRQDRLPQHQMRDERAALRVHRLRAGVQVALQPGKA